MILIVAPDARERAAFARLCESHNMPALECDTVRAFARALRRNRTRVVLTRQKLSDGYSDDVIALLTAARLQPAAKVIVLAAAGSSSAAEARQIALGADCVLRDPVRTDVLLAYLVKYDRTIGRVPGRAKSRSAKKISFAGAVLQPAERVLRCGQQTAQLTPREVELIELLLHSRGEIVTYDALYSEILGRPFRGDTSNMRVLLGKLGISAARVGIILRQWIEVIPKTGYRYRGVRRAVAAPAKSRHPFLSAA